MGENGAFPWFLLTLLDIMIVRSAVLNELKATLSVVACNMARIEWRAEIVWRMGCPNLEGSSQVKVIMKITNKSFEKWINHGKPGKGYKNALQCSLFTMQYSGTSL